MTVDSINILYIGAGTIAFGNGVVLWNHSARLENILGDRQNVVGLIEPSKERAEEVLEEKSKGAYKNSYAHTRSFRTVEEARIGLSDIPIDLILVAAPPFYRGTIYSGKDLELQAIKAFGESPTYFLEKPLSSTKPEEPAKLLQEFKKFERLNLGVGYMMRYLKVVQKAKQLIQQNNLKVMCVTARYAMAYQLSRKPHWWMKSREGGPIIEQGTHFCDLMRYFAGDVELDTVQATTLEHFESVGSIHPLHVDEEQINDDDRVPRVTSSFWKFKSGAVGNLTHIVALHGARFSNEITIFADGYQIRLSELYTTPTLYVRSPKSDSVEQIYNYPGDDSFFNELSAFVFSAAARRNKKVLLTEGKDVNEDDDLMADHFLSSYEDALNTFKLTWKIREQSDESSQETKSRCQSQAH